ncbi:MULTISPECIES: hypothetical protein [Xenorhabdus]|uniref:hypothetical protein n=1 Tax=Xenorhabdus TaxID=626 RepID=UPI00064B0D42|nr:MULTISPECIES: hypothetical protein [Xenorhabdus]KLU17192.1 hypothetical protein AAY47_01910 [Xenorhabdus griffiniae]KOP32732.1 hypothetical protein AFK69_13545 [Xenorhabdus sp. GDc328]
MEMKKTQPIITDQIREKAKSMVLTSPYGRFISVTTTLEIVIELAKKEKMRVNRRLRDVTKGMIGKYELDELNRLLKEIAFSNNTEKAFQNLVSYRNRFLSSAEERIALMNEFIGGDLDDLIEQGVPREELTQKVRLFRQQEAERQKAA